VKTNWRKKTNFPVQSNAYMCIEQMIRNRQGTDNVV
jgi:hypothetical protein